MRGRSAQLSLLRGSARHARAGRTISSRGGRRSTARSDADGYPKPLWNKLTGTIDQSVANYMRDNGYDLRDYAQKNWATLGPKVAGKLHFFAGDMDDF